MAVTYLERFAGTVANTGTIGDIMPIYLTLYLLSCVPFLLAATQIDYLEFNRKNRINDSQAEFTLTLIIISMLWPVCLLGAIIWRWWRWLH